MLTFTADLSSGWSSIGKDLDRIKMWNCDPINISFDAELDVYVDFSRDPVIAAESVSIVYSIRRRLLLEISYWICSGVHVFCVHPFTVGGCVRDAPEHLATS